ncbi:unnamed protein product [Musa hybrid cultivar]
MAAACYVSGRLTFLSCFVFFFFFFRISSFCFFAHATDTLTQGQSITDGQTLVSAGNIFELRFFSPGNSSHGRYVGILYHSSISATQTVVWVANREAPITGSGGRLMVTSDGDLVVLDGAGGSVWSTNSSAAPSNSSTTLQLLDTGNLVLQDGGGGTLWQSFDHPTHTFLPGMKLSLNTTTGKALLFTSWKSPDDPSAGNYTLGLDPNGSAQIFIWDRGVPRWRSGQWNGHRFIGTVMRSLYIYGFDYETDESQGIAYYTYTPHNASLVRFVMEWDGMERTFMQVQETRQWEIVWGQPINQCEVYGMCGVYGTCSDDGTTTTCSCLRGFEPRSSTEWSDGNWTSGCARKTPLLCQLNSSSNEDGFFTLPGAKLPDHSDWASTIGSESGCQEACSSNCSCRAYAYAASDIGCLLWGHDLIDIYQFEFPQDGYDLHVKLAASDLDAASDKTKLRVIVAVGCALGLLLAIIICFFLWWKYGSRAKVSWKKKRQQENTVLHPSGEVVSEFSSIYGEETQEGKASEPLFTFDCIATATGYFSDSNKLGEGGFGHVYKGTLPGGQEVAVKRLSRSSGQGLEEFKNEVILIAKLQHRNLVKLLGCCIQGEEKILIYEYLPNKSLDAIIFDTSKKELLDWKKRFNIIEGIARGLLYLHRDSRLRIVHRDLKASNVLLDENMNPKISDFGMARIFGADENQGNTNRVVGTFGYMSPEYAMEGLFSVRSDVYSFGILVLEILTARRNSSFHRMENAVNIVGYAWQLWNEDRAVELIDPTIRSASMMSQALRCVHIALLCVQDRASDRPDIDAVIRMMGSGSGPLPMPRQPMFVAVGSPDVTETKIANKYESFSTYDVTITMVQGR